MEHESTRFCDIAIIGGGLSGTLTAYHLARLGVPKGGVVLIEPQAHPGLGRAYATPFASHLLNVPALRMSALAHEPRHFLQWLAEHSQPQGQQPPWQPHDFVPRRLFGQYLQSLWHEAQALGQAGLCHVAGVAVAMQHDVQNDHPFVIEVADGVAGQTVSAKRVVLAMGHFLGGPPRVEGAELLGGEQLMTNAWDWQRLARIPKFAQVAVIGTGLTMVDVTLALMEQGFLGSILAVSRHGLVPSVHADVLTTIAAEALPTTSARELIGALRRRVRGHIAAKGDWRQVIDALRPHTTSMWRSLSPRHQAQILRHAKTFWDVHRHRIAPHVGRQLAHARHSGQLTIAAGRLVRVQATRRAGCLGPTLSLTWQRRHDGTTWQQDADLLILATGGHADWRRVRSPLLDHLNAQHLFVCGPHTMGLNLDEDGALLAQDGRCIQGLYALGNARLGLDFESVAAPELRQQAERLAKVVHRAML